VMSGAAIGGCDAMATAIDVATTSSATSAAITHPSVRFVSVIVYLRRWVFKRQALTRMCPFFMITLWGTHIRRWVGYPEWR